jgi:hypothetical protein
VLVLASPVQRDERLDVERVVASATAQAEVHVDVAGEEVGGAEPAGGLPGTGRSKSIGPSAA